MKLLKASFAADCILCRRSLVHKEERPLGEERWFESSYRAVSICLLIGDICQITLFTMNTIDWLCLWYLQNAGNQSTVIQYTASDGLSSFLVCSLLRCQHGSQTPLLIKLTLLDNSRFHVQIHILHGLALPVVNSFKKDVVGGHGTSGESKHVPH